VARVRVNCPTCRRELDWHSAPFRPFCSERCRLIDLGAWLAERHAIAGEDVTSQEGAAPPPPAPED
jgi:endogenous inhibitor of DNA gyrase (YacG/DUF329 family)